VNGTIGPIVGRKCRRDNRLPRSTRLASVGVTLITASGSAGSPGFATTPSGPLSQLAVIPGPPLQVDEALAARCQCGRHADDRSSETERCRGTRRHRHWIHGAGRARDWAATGRHVDRQHRQSEERRFEQRLLVETANVRRGREIRELRLHERFADGDRRSRAAGTQLPGEIAVRAARCIRGSRCRRIGIRCRRPGSPPSLRTPAPSRAAA
jgi:hypothetical protein